MKKLLFQFLLLLQVTSYTYAEKTIRIACVGNSITYGAGIANIQKNSYPAQLQAFLGEKYEVRNFGVSGSTLLSNGDRPYRKTTAWQEALNFQPDVVLIKLGTNDTKPQNWKYKDEFIGDYQKMIAEFKALSSNPRIILLTPVRCFLPDEAEIKSLLIANTVRPWVEKIAYDNELEIINLFNVYGDQWQQHLMPDKLHPSSIGAGVIAEKIFKYLTAPELLTAKQPTSLKSILGNSNVSEFNFHGYQGYEFIDKGTTCFIVQPKSEAAGKPWLIRARFWGHEPQTDIELLENGFHLVYCDVADLYGSQEAVRRWNSIYKKMRKAGFHKKVVLEGMSRGGLIVYNWAAQNPEKVACIYADAPVMDFKSWPMGKGKSAGSSRDTENLLKAYGFKNEQEALSWDKNPIDCAKRIAKRKIPILHVVGDKDDIVPLDENTSVFESRMKELDQPITVIHKPEIGHHPHSLNNPKPISQFILSATGMHRNLCLTASPGNEYRSGAGWKEGHEWHSVAEDITATLKDRKLKVLLLGNSITQGWGGQRNLVTYKPGKQIMDRLLGEAQWESAGISGDRVQNLLWRLRYGNYTACDPENVIISIGINNLIAENDKLEDVAAGLIAVADEARTQFPDKRIILMGLLPSGKEKNNAIRIKCDTIHSILAKHNFKGIEYINPTSWFTDAEGTITPGTYSSDYIHLSDKGYEIWGEKIKELID